MQSATGYVYVFNAYLDVMKLSVNQSTGYPFPVGPIAAVAGPPPAPFPYRPTSVQVQRVQSPPADIGFVNGTDNSVVVQLRGGRQSDLAWVSLPAVGDSTDDQWLYVTYELLLLLSTEGKITAGAGLSWG